MTATAQTRAHARVAAAVKAGLLPRLDGSVGCACCPAPASVYDHRDYSRPLDVTPVCRSCNKVRGSAPGWKPPKVVLLRAPRWLLESAAYLARQRGISREALIRGIIRDWYEAGPGAAMGHP